MTDCVQITLATLLLALTSSSHAEEVTRRVITTGDDQVIGYSKRSIRRLDDGSTVRKTVRRIRQQEGRARARTTVETSTVTENAAGQVTTMEKSVTGNGAGTLIMASIGDDTINVERTAYGDRRNATLDRVANMRFDNGAGLLSQWDQAGLDSQVFYKLNIDAPSIEQVVLENTPGVVTEPGRRVLRSTYRDLQLQRVEVLKFDADGHQMSTEQPWFGTTLVRRATEDAAPPPTVSLVRQMLVKSPARIPNRARRGHIRYQFAFTTDVHFRPIQTGEQRSTPMAEGFTLDICAECGPGLPTTDDYLAASLRPSFWLQSDHRMLTRFTRQIARQKISDTQKMQRLTAKATRRMKDIDFVGHYSALEALKRKSGDCTEGAVVLAALGRAAGIPTRVVSGLVYSRERYHGVAHAFMPHAWTLAYVDGQWRSFDMSLGEFDATHIALAISDGDPSGISAGFALAGLISWTDLNEVRIRPQQAN